MVYDPIALGLSKLPSWLRLTIVLSGALLIHLAIGSYHTFGNMLPYMASYMRNRTDESVRVGSMMWIPTLQGCFPFAMVIGGLLSSRLGPRWAALIGCALATFSGALSYYTIKRNFVLFSITYGAMFGIGQGTAYITAMMTAINWAPKKVGLISGIVSAGFGVSSSIFAPIQTLLINPENFEADEQGYFHEQLLLERIPRTFITLAIVYAVMEMIGLIVICDPPKTDNVNHTSRRADKERCITETTIANSSSSESSEESVAEETCSGADTITSEEANLTSLQMVRCSTFWVLFWAFFCCSYYTNAVYNLYKTFGETLVNDDKFLSYCLSLGCFANSVARIGWGILVDRVSFKKAMIAVCLFAHLLLVTFHPVSVQFGKWAFLVWLVLLFICMASNHSLFVTAIVKCFGAEHKTINYGCLVLSTFFSGILLSFVSQYLLNIIGYHWMFGITSLFPLTALLLTLSIGKTSHGHYIC